MIKRLKYDLSGATPELTYDAELANLVLADDPIAGLLEALAGQFVSDEEGDIGPLARRAGQGAIQPSSL